MASTIDFNIFNQLLEMDDEGDHEFSKGIVLHFFEQAKSTFSDIEKALERNDLEALGKLGHFLKGSSASLGITRLQKLCEHIQYFGRCKDVTGLQDISEEEARRGIVEAFGLAKEEFAVAEQELSAFYAGL